MRVTQVTGEYPPMRGGVADYTRLLARELRQEGHEVSVLTSRLAQPGACLDDDLLVDASVDDWGVGLWRALDAHLESFRPDVVNIQYQTGAFGMRLGVNFLPWLARRRRDRPAVVVTFHDLKEPYLLPKLGRGRHLATLALAAGSDAVIVTNHEDHARVAGRRDPDRTRPLWGGRPLAAIPIGSNVPPVGPGYDRAGWRARLGVAPDETAIAFFGFLVPSKGIETLFDAFCRLVVAGRPVRLLMVGAARGEGDATSEHLVGLKAERRDAGLKPGFSRPSLPWPGRPSGRARSPFTSGGACDYEHTLRRRVDATEIRDHVTWTGFLAPEEVAAALSAADLVCLPFRAGASLRHGTLMAALAQKLPIVTTRPEADSAPLPGLRDWENALLVPPDDPAALAAAIEALIADPEQRRRLVDGAGRLSAAFEWGKIAAQTLEFYRRIV